MRRNRKQQSNEIEIAIEAYKIWQERGRPSCSQDTACWIEAEKRVQVRSDRVRPGKQTHPSRRPTGHARRFVPKDWAAIYDGQ